VSYDLTASTCGRWHPWNCEKCDGSLEEVFRVHLQPRGFRWLGPRSAGPTFLALAGPGLPDTKLLYGAVSDGRGRVPRHTGRAQYAGWEELKAEQELEWLRWGGG